MTTVKERPILFSGPMIRAILDGRKTQTRRVVKPRFGGKIIGWGGQGVAMESIGIIDGCENIKANLCPYGKPGSTLWVREAWAETDLYDGTPVIAYKSGGYVPIGKDGQDRDRLIMDWASRSADPDWHVDKWRPSIHMPRWASRILLEVTDVRVQRVQDISESDCWAEGCEGYDDDVTGGMSGYREFSSLWESIHGPGAWERNDWVWAVTFKRVD